MAKEPYFLQDNFQKSSGKFAQFYNINACIQVADAIRTTLGPKGMDKMVVDSSNNIIVTNDGVTILKELQIEHPAARMLVEIAKTQEKEVGDGTTTAVIIAGELLRKSQELLSEGIHPTIISKGYRIAYKKSLEIINQLSINLDDNKKDLLKKVVETAITGKGAEYGKEKLSDLIVGAVLQVIDGEEFDKDSIKIEKIIGEELEDSFLLDGYIIEREIVHSSMKKEIKDAKILLLNSGLEVRKTEIDSKYDITSPQQFQSFVDMEENMLKNMVNKIVESGANFVVCQKGIDEVAQFYLAKNGISAIRRVAKSDMEKISKAVSGNIVSDVNNINKNDLGFAGLIKQKNFSDTNYIFINSCKNPKAVSIVIRGSTEHVIDETLRAVDDAIGDVGSVIKNKKLLVGAGSVEMELSLQLLDFANSFGGKEQLAIIAFAKSLEVIPKTLAENSGLDTIEIITNLRKIHKDKDKKYYGIDVFTGEIVDARQKGILEPLKIKEQALSSAIQVSNMILRIDDVILSNPKDNSINNTMNNDFDS
ncbi:MAG: thermosome subunit alpha [Candidatus Nanoarchaeia archaeon]|nr:thermosome subunit alpha [Candidatus Nanoarchaeia archaeon]